MLAPRAAAVGYWAGHAVAVAVAVVGGGPGQCPLRVACLSGWSPMRSAPCGLRGVPVPVLVRRVLLACWLMRVG